MTKSSRTQDAANFDPSTSTARLVEASLLVPSPSSSTDLQSMDMRFRLFGCISSTCSWPKGSTAWVLAQCFATWLARDSKTGPMFHTSASLLLEPQPSNKIVKPSPCCLRGVFMTNLFHIQLLDLPLFEVFQTDFPVLAFLLFIQQPSVLKQSLLSNEKTEEIL